MYKNLRLDIDKISHLKSEDLISFLQQLEKQYNHLAETANEKNRNLVQCEENEIRYKSIFELSSDAILIIENGKFVECNKAVLSMLGYRTKNEFLNTHPSVLSPEKQPDGRFSYEKADDMMQIALEKGYHKFEWIHTRSNGEDFPVEVQLSAVEIGGRTVINTIWRDLTDIKKKEEIINRNITEKEILIKEIHHRVKNNFQIVSSLLNLQTEFLEDQQFRTLYMQCKNRIDSMCKVHEMMYRSDNLTSVSIHDYLKELLGIISNSTLQNQINYKVNGENLHLNINYAIPIGLIINEIITNSYKYAFPQNENGNIEIFISKKGTLTQIDIQDNGIGYSSDLFVENSPTLGFQLIFSLVSQIDGKIEKINHQKGTHYQIQFQVV